MGLFGRRKERHGGERKSGQVRVEDDRVAALLATYDPNTELSPDDAAELGAKIRAVYDSNPDGGAFDGLYPVLRRLEQESGLVRGRHYTEWVPTLDELRSSRDDDGALALLLECIDAAERAARVAGMEPAPGYTKRAAVIYRRRKDYASEIQVLERWEAAAPPRYKGAMKERLAAARKLQEKHQG